MLVIAHKNLGLQPQIYGTENRGMSVQLLGNTRKTTVEGRYLGWVWGESRGGGDRPQKKREEVVGVLSDECASSCFRQTLTRCREAEQHCCYFHDVDVAVTAR